MSILNGEEALGASKTYTKKEMHKVYKPAGTKAVAELTSELLVAENLGNVYNAADSGVTTSDFVEGPGKPINAGDNIDIVDIGSGDSHVYKFDLYMGADLSSKADKVTNATSGHLAGLDSNGNLTDSGVSPTEDVTVEGNPVTFESPFEQDAKSVVVSVKPIQAGSGTPSPENIRPISGIDEVEITVADKDYLDMSDMEHYGIVAANGMAEVFAAEQAYPVYNPPVGQRVIVSRKSLTDTGYFWFGTYAENHLANHIYPITYGNLNNVLEATIDIPEGANMLVIFTGSDYPVDLRVTQVAPTTTTIPLPSTLYGGTVDVTEGSADSRFGFVQTTWGEMTNPIDRGSGIESRAVSTPNALTTPDTHGYNLTNVTNNEALNTQANVHFFVSNLENAVVFLPDTTPDSTVIQICYELATPTTLSLTPTDVELLEGTNVLTTNGEKVAVTYGRSLWQDIDELKTDTEGKLDKSDVADVEGDTASRAYSVNEFMLRSDGLYKVTQPIAQNASITASNTEKTTIGAVLTALLNA